MSDVPKPPTGLRAPGKQLWNDIGRYVLTGGELEILRQAAHAVDEAAELKRELRKQPAIVAGHAGQPRPNPLNKMLDDKRELIRRLIADLNLPDDEEEVGRTPSQRHAAKAAAARWAPGAS